MFDPLSWSSVIKRVLIAAYLFLRIRADGQFYEISLKHRNELKKLRAEIESLRSSGGTDNALLADKLLNDIEEEKRFFKDISTTNSVVRAWDRNPDERGDLQSPK